MLGTQSEGNRIALVSQKCVTQGVTWGEEKWLESLHSRR